MGICFKRYGANTGPLTVTVWYSSITQSEEKKIERIQKTAFRIILAGEYETYGQALMVAGFKLLTNEGKFYAKNLPRIASRMTKCVIFSPLTQQTQDILKNSLYNQQELKD